MTKKRIGIIGFGGRVSGLWNLVYKQARDFELSAICDVRPPEKLQKSIMDNHADPEKIKFYTDVDEMLEKEDLDGVMIGTNCNTHTEFAVKVLNKNIPLYLEKPVCINYEELEKLRTAGKGKEKNVVVSFPLRVTPLAYQMKELIAQGKIGEPNFCQAWNYPNYGDVYYREWYRDDSIMHGLWLQKATHDFDYITNILGLEPTMICAMMQKQVFKGDMPENLYCVDCDKFEECPQAPYKRYIERNELDMIPARGDREAFPYQCQFAKDTDNEDAGCAVIRYNTGMIASYSQCFFARNAAGSRGCRIVGYDGTAEFDWKDEKVIFYSHRKPIIETIDCHSTAGHGGGDDILIDSFVHLVRGTGKSVADLTDGLKSAYMCLKAKDSCLTNQFMSLKY